MIRILLVLAAFLAAGFLLYQGYKRLPPGGKKALLALPFLLRRLVPNLPVLLLRILKRLFIGK